MKVIKFTKHDESVLSFDEKEFKRKYEEKTGKNRNYKLKTEDGEKYLALCPKCNNPVVILGIFKKIDAVPHARHIKNVDIPNITQYNEYKYLNCPYHKKKANYVKEYVPETEEPERQQIYEITKTHFDKAIYLLQKTIGIYINTNMAKELAENYVSCRAYNYIDATIYNIPWYLIYSYSGFLLQHLLIKKNTVLHRHLKKLGLALKESKRKDYVYVEDHEGYEINAVNYRYSVNTDGELDEWLDFSILLPDDTIKETLLYVVKDRFSIKVDSYYFGNLINYKEWSPNQNMLNIAKQCMNT